MEDPSPIHIHHTLIQNLLRGRRQVDEDAKG